MPQIALVWMNAMDAQRPATRTACGASQYVIGKGAQRVQLKPEDSCHSAAEQAIALFR